MCNRVIRNAIICSGLKYWQVAEKLGIADSNFSRKLRHELPDAEKMRILSIIEEIRKEVE